MEFSVELVDQDDPILVDSYIPNMTQTLETDHQLPVLSSFTTYKRVCNHSNTTGSTSEAGTTYPSGASEFTPVLSGVRVTRSLVLCVMFVDRCLFFCSFSFGHCVVCPSIYRF